MYTVPSTLVGRFCSHGILSTRVGHHAALPGTGWGWRGLSLLKVISCPGLLEAQLACGPPLLGQDWALGRAGGAMGHVAGCPAPAQAFGRAS